MHVPIDRASPVALTDQLFSSLKRMILDGALGAGARLPPTRSLAEELGVSRTVVVDVFERLAAEGFVEPRQGAGTYVADGALLRSAPPWSESSKRRTTRGARSRPEVGFGPLRTDIIDFRTGVPELREFPLSAWQRLQRQVWETISPMDLAYGAPEGRAELRGALCAYLRVHRGVSCSPEQIILTSGTTQAIVLVSSALGEGGFAPPIMPEAGRDADGETTRRASRERAASGRGAAGPRAPTRRATGRSNSPGRRAAVVEDPVTGDIRRIIARNGLAVEHVEIDAEGLDARLLPRSLPEGGRVAFVYVTPSHHYPLGVSMPIDRRVSLVEYARRTGCYLVEDDYDSEFRYRMPPVSTLYELAPDRVLYIGTFSKTLSPALRTAFIVAPWELVESLRAAKWHADLHGASPDQLVLARLLDEGIYVRHLLRMRKLYERRWLALRKSLEASFHDRVEILGSPAGMHVAARFAGVRFDEQFLSRIERSGAKFYPVSLHTVHPADWEDCLVIGFGHLDIQRIGTGIGLLAEAIGESSGR